MAQPVPSASDALATNAITIGVPREVSSSEHRVGLVPEAVNRLKASNLHVVIESGAGEGSSISDDEFAAAGAEIVATADAVYDRATVIVQVQAPDLGANNSVAMRAGTILIAYLAPLVNHDLVNALSQARVTSFSMDAVPRITRAQSMDSISAMSTISGYKAVLLAADNLPKFFPLLMTAAGTIAPARVLVIGAGVAGLQAIATAHRLGAVVEAYDTRPVVKEQVESLGAKFVEIDTGTGDTQEASGYARAATEEELRLQQEGLNDHVANADVVITTALVPGRPAPKLIPASAVERMHSGSVIVDLAGEAGGNCELSQPGESVVSHGVTILAPLNLPSTMAVHASQMYARTIQNLLGLLAPEGKLHIDFDDEIVRGMCITHNGTIVHEGTRKAMGLDSLPESTSETPAVVPEPGLDPATDEVNQVSPTNEPEPESIPH